MGRRGGAGPGQCCQQKGRYKDCSLKRERARQSLAIETSRGMKYSI